MPDAKYCPQTARELLQQLVDASCEPGPAGCQCTCCRARAYLAAPAQAEPREPTPEMIDAAVDRFLAWPLPKGFAPDCGISFDGRKDDEWNKNKSWPIGTNLFTADQARAMFQHALAAPAQAEPRDVPLTPGNWPLIALGYGQVEVAEGHHDGVAALIFGRNGTGKIGEPTQPERAHLPGETLAVVTFANVESLDVVARKLATIRAKCAPSPAAQAEPREWTPPREMVKHVQPYRYEAAPSPAAEAMLERAERGAKRPPLTEQQIIDGGIAFVMGPGGDEGTRQIPAAEDGLVDLGEPDAWLHTGVDGYKTLWFKQTMGDPPGCLIALYAEPRIEVAYAARIERLVKELRIAEAKSRGTLTNNLCSDHRDKQSGKPCLACEIERQTQEIERLTRLNALNVRDGNFLDSMWCCKVCDGEIPDGHTDDCYIWKLEKRHRDFIANEYNAALRRAEALREALQRSGDEMSDKPFPALCRDCKWSAPESGIRESFANVCTNPHVVATHPWALANNREGGPAWPSCSEERKRKWLAPCGINGKRWERRRAIRAQGDDRG